jgi:hypothetical protein
MLFYQYAKVMGKSAFGPEAKSQSYAFIKQSFRDLCEGRKHWSDRAGRLIVRGYIGKGCCNSPEE